MEFTRIPVERIRPCPEQPRTNFDEDRLQELAESIKEVGQLQPVIVKKSGDEYLLIAGERRYRAIRDNNQQREIAAVILEDEISDQSLRQIQLVENLQREDLDPMERALSIRDFIENNELTKKEGSNKLGIPRTTLTEWLNILEVKEEYQQAVLDNDSSLTLSHISLSKGLASKTGDPTKQNQLLDAVLKYNLTRNETKEVINLFYKYLHLSMDEAIGAILIKREHHEYRLDKSEDEDNSQPASRLLSLLNRLGESLERIMDEQQGEFSEQARHKLLDEFVYVYQLLEIMVPELKNKSLSQLIEEIKGKTG
ncbi:MAG: ParB/RepB/Spo0J family partition protein [Bacillota bacterium]